MTRDAATIRPTPAGWGVLASGTATAVCARLLGVDEFVVAGIVAILLVVIATVVIWRWRPRLQVDRTVQPRRVEVDSACSVTLTITNTSKRASLVGSVWDRVDGAAPAALLLAPVAPHSSRVARHQFVGPHRGVLQVGPLMIHCTDPFGLVRVVIVDHAVADVIVLPRIHHLAALPSVNGDDPDSGGPHSRNLVHASEEFATLRGYLPGDDVRRVHWPSTARLGTPVVRHHEHPWQPRTTVVLDDRRSHHDADSFERAVSATASVLVSARRRGESVRWITASGRDSGFVDDDATTDDLLNQLAAMTPADLGSLDGALRRGGAKRLGGQLVACLGAVEPAELASLAGAAATIRRPVAVACRGNLVVDPRVATTVAYGDGASLTHAWARAANDLAK